MFNNWITIGDDKSYSEVRGWFHLKEEDMSHWQALVLDNIRAIKNQKMIEYVEKNPFIIPKSLATRSYSLDGGSTGIETIGNSEFIETYSYYDLQGRRISQPVRKGIYILNGKKVTIK